MAGGPVYIAVARRHHAGAGRVAGMAGRGREMEDWGRNGAGSGHFKGERWDPRDELACWDAIPIFPDMPPSFYFELLKENCRHKSKETHWRPMEG